ncbi:MAG: NAD(P)-binding protein [Nitriliruptorales bacterium]|nr:NAD(P)-binding protein [Nitriliruptorales bacterium]
MGSTGVSSRHRNRLPGKAGDRHRRNAMPETADVVIAGAGHNSLITTAYLAKAGYECLVLDTRAEPGGGAATEELLLPGYHFDSCSTGHTLIQVNPLLTRDELGLFADYGLAYVEPDPVAHVAFPDGEHFTMWLDVDRTCEELSRFSDADADAYRRMLAEFDEIKDVFGRYRFTPIGYGPSLEDALAQRPGGAKWLRRNAISAWDVIRREFGSRHVRAFMVWMAFQTAQPIDSPGSGLLAYSLIAGRQQRSWTLPLGGSASLPRALVRMLEDHGGRVLTRRTVTGLVLDGGRCVGVETDDGQRYLARRAVLSSIHVKSLVEMAPSDAWDKDFLYGIDTFDPGISAFASYYATSEPPRFTLKGGGSQTAVSAGYAAWPEDVIAFERGLREGRVHLDGAFLLFATPSLADPSRAPGGGHTVKILSMAPFDLREGTHHWETYRHELAGAHLAVLQRLAPNLTEDTILARSAKSPVDIERANPHMWRGTIHGGDRGLANSGPLRPAPGWAHHRMPISGLYQTGATTHPGGSVTGGPGRNAAVVMLDDLGTSLEEVVARTAAPAG